MRMAGWMDGWGLGGWMDKRIRVDRWMDGWMNGLINGVDGDDGWMNMVREY